MESIPGLSNVLCSKDGRPPVPGTAVDLLNHLCASCTDAIAQAYLASLSHEETTPMTLTVAPMTFSVTVPTSIPISVDANGVATCPNNIKIVNNSAGAVRVSSVRLDEGAWGLEPYNGGDRKNLAAMPADTKKFGFQLKAGGNVAGTTQSGSQTLGIDPELWVIGGTASGGTHELPVECSAIATAVKTAVSGERAADIVFTVEWDSSLIEFFLKDSSYGTTGQTYQAEKGTTWEMWCNSSYNTPGFVVEGSLIRNSAGSSSSLRTADNTSYSVAPSDLIVGGAEYVFSNEPSKVDPI